MNFFQRNLTVPQLEEKKAVLVGEETDSEWYILNSEECILGHTLGFAQVGSKTSSAMLIPNLTQVHEHLLSTYWARPEGKDE